MKDGDMGGTCNVHGGNNKFIKNFCQKISKTKDHLGDLGVNAMKV
jgi:hypothetical protein